MNFYISISKPKFFVIINLLIVSILLVTYVFFLEKFAVNHIIGNGLRTQSENLIKNGDKFSTVLIGTSHTTYGEYLMKINNTFFDYGESYTYPHIMYVKLKMLIKYAPNLNTIVLEADTHQFYDFAMNNSTSYNKFLTVLKINDNTLNKLNLVSFDNEIKPILHTRLRHYIKGKLGSNKRNIQKKKLQSWDSLSHKEQSRQTMDRHNYYKINSPVMNDESKKYFEKTIKLAKSNGINVVLIQHPMAKIYFDLMDKKVIHDTNEYINYIKHEYNLELLDFKTLFENNNTMFLNQDHLNTTGKKRFSLILNSYIDKK